MTASHHLRNCLIGGAVGDALGLPSEGLTAKRIQRLRPGPLKHQLLGGKGMVSDDTEHAVMTVLSLNEASDDPDKFANQFAMRLRWWLTCIPAGVGLATAKSSIKLWFGCSPAHSGVISAGNGPLMRAPVIGVHFRDNLELRDRFTKVSTLITHRDSRALEAARLVAAAAALACDGKSGTEEILNRVEILVESNEMKIRFPLLRQGLHDGLEVGAFSDGFSRKQGFVSGFAPDSASVALFAWLRHRHDYRKTVESVIRAGGDTDTTAFIAGSLAGIDCGVENIPAEWTKNLLDWPIHIRFLQELSNGQSHTYPRWPLGLLRNGLFLIVVLTHGFRRLLPPY